MTIFFIFIKNKNGKMKIIKKNLQQKKKNFGS